MKKLAIAFLLLCSGGLQPAISAELPQLGTKFKPLPKGIGRQSVEIACLPCHSADILVQQRLNEKQWTAEVDKMIRWGAVVADADKAKMIVYLLKNFGPENKFTPTRVRAAH